MVTLRADEQRQPQIRRGHAPGQEPRVLLGQIVLFVLDDDIHREGGRDFSQPAHEGQRGARAVGAEERALAVHRAARGRQGLAHRDEPRQPRDLVEHVGAQDFAEGSHDDQVGGPGPQLIHRFRCA